MLEMVLGAAFSAVPLILLIPPIRRFTIFAIKFEDLLQDFIAQTSTIFARLRFVTSLFLHAPPSRSGRYNYPY